MCLGIILSCQTCKNEMVIFNKTPCFKEKKKKHMQRHNNIKNPNCTLTCPRTTLHTYVLFVFFFKCSSFSHVQ